MVTDSAHTIIPYANVYLTSPNSTRIIKYAFTNKDGNYEIATDEAGKYNLNASALSYSLLSIPMEIRSGQKNIKIDIILHSKTYNFKEVIVTDDLPIKEKGDTIVYKAEAFTRGNEEVVEDLLKNLPGFNVSSDGKIRIGSQEIEKVMVEGDDFFENGYTILTKNMPSEPIDNIELLRHYSENELLKDVEQSDKYALNLKLKEGVKRRWFGNAKASWAFLPGDGYTANANLMNFGKKSKYYFIADMNNIGEDATGDVENFINPPELNKHEDFGNGENADRLMNLEFNVPNLAESRTNFNDDKMLSLNSIFRPVEKVKLKVLGFLNSDVTRHYRNRLIAYQANNVNFTNSEDYVFEKASNTGYGQADLSWFISERQKMESATRYSNVYEKGRSDLWFNGEPTKEKLKTFPVRFDQKLTLTNKLKDKTVLLLNARYTNESSPQQYTVNRYFYQDLFPGTHATGAGQDTRNDMQFAGMEARLLVRHANGNLLDLSAGNKTRYNHLVSAFSLLSEGEITGFPPAFQNNIWYTASDLYLDPAYRFEFKKIALTAQLGLHQLFNHLKTDSLNTKQNPRFVSPSLSFEWNVNNNNKFILSYRLNKTNAGILDVYENDILTGYRSFEKGTGRFDQLNSSSLMVNYRLGNWLSRFVGNVYAIYLKNHDFFSTNTTITPNYSLSDRIVIHHRELLVISATAERFLRPLWSNLKLKTSFTNTNFKNIINGSGLREIRTGNYNYGAELKSGFSGFFNYHIGTEWKIVSVKTSFKNSYTDNITFTDLMFSFAKQFNLGLKAERHYFGNLEKENATYYFLDIQTRYVVKKNRLTCWLKGNNLFNTNVYRQYSIDDVSMTTTEYRLLPRMVLLGAEIRL
ncbi:MAG TPA: carboxypeptidase-like regulatory domain-containing protein [Bacteroidales bacterium]|nr:carboxypeptidase-like regulatory domain-containing protein [Bacteroidales bacterium]